MAVINRLRAMTELARQGAFVLAPSKPDSPIPIVCEDAVIGHLRWTTWKSMVEAGIIEEIPRGPGQPADATCYRLRKDA